MIYFQPRDNWLKKNNELSKQIEILVRDNRRTQNMPQAQTDWNNKMSQWKGINKVGCLFGF